MDSKFCPGVIPLFIFGKDTDNYYTSHPSVCNKSSRKLTFKYSLLFSVIQAMNHFLYWNMKNYFILKGENWAIKLKCFVDSNFIKNDIYDLHTLVICSYGNLLEGAYEDWKYRNTVDYIANYRWNCDLFRELQFFVSFMWSSNQIPSKMYPN